MVVNFSPAATTALTWHMVEAGLKRSPAHPNHRPTPTRELMLVRSFIPDFDEFIANHPTLVAVCVVLKESYNLLVHIQVRRCAYRGAALAAGRREAR